MSVALRPTLATLMAATMPTSIKVGATIYRVITDAQEIKRVSDENTDDDNQWTAFSNHDHLIIGINPLNHDDVNRVTLLHEIMHCCLRVGGVWPDAYSRVVASACGQTHGVSVEEFTVTGMAHQLLVALQENPQLTAWLMERPI